MSEFLFQYYPVHPTTWVYLSSLLMICVFFKFSRFWSVRNLDLVLLILLAPGLILVHFGEQRVRQELMGRHVAAASAVAAGNSAEGPSGVDNRPVDAAASEDDLPFGESTLPVESTPTEQPSTVGDDAGEIELSNESSDLIVVAVPDEDDPESGQSITYLGYLWLFIVGVLFCLRLLLDPTMVRRPLLEPNLATGGLAFMGIAMFVFLMANVVSSQPTAADLDGPRSAERLLSGVAEESSGDFRRHGPGNAILHFIPSLVTTPLSWTDPGEAEREVHYVRTAKAMAILSHLAVVVGIVLVGYWHFDNAKMGFGAATMYLMLPYAAIMTGRVDHALPAALLVWAVLCYRRPLWAGIFIGLAIGVVYYPLFLLPLWISFYWQRGLARFISGVASTLAIIALSLILISSSVADYVSNLQALFGIWLPGMYGLQGVWGLRWDPSYRLPVMAAFVCVSGALALWPAQKNLGTLLSCSAGVMIGTQLWHGYGGGLYMAWYLPLTILTVFRPNLEDRVALTVLGKGWFQRRKPLAIGKAA